MAWEMPDAGLHIMVVVEPLYARGLDWPRMRREAGERSAAVSLLEVEGSGAKWRVPAGLAGNAPSSVLVAFGSGAATVGSGSAVIDKLFEAQALVPAIRATEIRLFAGQLVESELADALQAEATIRLTVFEGGIFRAGRSSVTLSGSAAGDRHGSAATAGLTSPPASSGVIFPRPSVAMASVPVAPALGAKRWRSRLWVVGTIFAAVVIALGVMVHLSSEPRYPGASPLARDDLNFSADPDESSGVTVTEENGSVSRPVAPPTADLHSGAESRYSADYAAKVEAVAQDGLQVHVNFTASGISDLRRPETSCLIVEGVDGARYIARPTAVALTTDSAGLFSGRMSFPAVISGSYGLQYSCTGDYSTADIGIVEVPSVGVSRYSDSYYAVILGFEGTLVHFVAIGQADLRTPESSCVIRDGQPRSPTVSREERRLDQSVMLAGTMSFPGEVAGSSFVYSCADYTAVILR